MEYDASKIRPVLGVYPKTKPLTEKLVNAALQQGVSLEEFAIACDLAKCVLRHAVDLSRVPFCDIESEVSSALERVSEDTGLIF